MIIDEKANAPFKPDYHQHVFAAIRDVAVHGLVELENGERVALLPDEDAR